MNEKIKQLAEQADKLSIQYANKNNVNHIDAFNIVFAELIVKKCANIVWDEAEKISSPTVNDAGYKIIEYFHGVKE